MSKKISSISSLSHSSDNPLRPAIGNCGKKIQVAVNIFPITKIADITAFQFDVKITPELPPALARKIWDSVEKNFRLCCDNKRALLAYDGKNIAFSTSDLSKGNQEISIPIEFENQSFSVTLKKVATIMFHDLLLFLNGKGTETDNSLHAMNCLSTALQHLPAMTYTSIGSNFFTPKDKVQISGGLEVWRGYHQSFRAMMAGHLGINIDVAATVFRKGDIPLLDLAMEILEVRDMNQLSKKPRIIDLLNAELKGINVVTTHRGDSKQRFKIASLSKIPAQNFSFEIDGKTWTIVDYFQDQYNITLKYPWLPVALKSNMKTAFPLEILKVQPSQRFMKKLNGQQTSDMIRATVQKPHLRKKQIESAVSQIIGLQKNDYLNSFGIQVSNQMMKIPARVLPAPSVVFAQEKSASGKEGSWNLRGFKLKSAPPMKSFSFVFFVRIGQSQASEIRDSLLTKWSNAGMNIQTKKCPISIVNPSSRDAVVKGLQSSFADATKMCGSRCQILVCIIDKEPKSLYEEIKKITLTVAGVITQCLQFSNVRNGKDIKDQFAANVAMKVNIKLGGCTNYVDKLPGFNVPTMLVGADVTHPHAGSNAPSIAAIVTSSDKNATIYHTFLKAQGPRVEIIKEMEEVFGLGLDRFREATKVYPTQVFFFRDGVAAGQFAEVRATEIVAVKKALQVRGLADKCNLVFMVVQKRHHVRLFPIDRENEDRSGNCQPGTVIDSHVMHPSENNFILQSHSGIQGTSRPCIYHILYDEIKLDVDVLQQLCFNLCFLSERATRSISMVAPAYRAHLAAFYGRMFVETESDGKSDDKDMVVKWKNVTDAISRTMYYM